MAHILSPDDLTPELVKNYLSKSFKWRRPKKDFKLYINLCIIYERYPETIKELLTNIPTLGYYNDYFYILMFSKNMDLDTYIYDIVINQLKSDINSLSTGQKISTLGKWLPREKSNINKRCGFIDKFCAKFYPDILNKFTARRLYRKLKTQLNEKIGTIEAKLCTKKFDQIDYTKVAPFALIRHAKTLSKNEICRQAFDEYNTNMLSKLGLVPFTKQIFLQKHLDKIEKIWHSKRFRFNINLDLSNCACLIDLSNATYNANAEFLTIGIALLVDKYSKLAIKLVINNEHIMNLTGDITDRFNQIINYVGPCTTLDINYCRTTLAGLNGTTDFNLLVVTTQDLMMVPQMYHIKPHDKTYDLVYHDGANISTKLGIIKPVKDKVTIQKILDTTIQTNYDGLMALIISVVLVIIYVVYQMVY